MVNSWHNSVKYFVLNEIFKNLSVKKMSCAACLEAPPVITCTCLTGACVSCFIQYGKPECMSCRAPFRKSSLSSKLVKEVYRPFHEKSLWERESALLANTQTLVEWQNATAELKKRLRFGERVVFPPKPTTLLSTTGVFACPASTCRGFVTLGQCGVCRSKVCLECRELKEDDHMCSAETLETLKAIQQDSKPCPSCTTNIFRIEGCNHMFCTNCRTHWDWISKRILSNSTNHHYLRSEKFNQQAIRLTRECRPVGVDKSLVPHSKIFKYLYTDGDSAQSILRAFQMEKNTTIYTEALIQIRINFLNKTITEKEAAAKVYVAEQQFHKKCDIADLCEMYLSTLLDLQHVWRAENFRESKVHDLLTNLLEMCNEASQSIFKEYGGVVPFFELSPTVPCVTLK